MSAAASALAAVAVIARQQLQLHNSALTVLSYLRKSNLIIIDCTAPLSFLNGIWCMTLSIHSVCDARHFSVVKDGYATSKQTSKMRAAEAVLWEMLMRDPLHGDDSLDANAGWMTHWERPTEAWEERLRRSWEDSKGMVARNEKVGAKDGAEEDGLYPGEDAHSFACRVLKWVD